MSSSAQKPGPSRHANPVVAFIIGLAIILLASVLNAAGLNLTKLDHVRNKLNPLLCPNCVNRCAQVQFQRLHEREIGCDHYGFLEWFSICLLNLFYFILRLSHLDDSDFPK